MGDHASGVCSSGGATVSELITPFPAVFREQCLRAREIRQSGRIGCRHLGASAGHKPKFGNLLALLGRMYQADAAIELTDDIEDLLSGVDGRRPRCEHPANSQVLHRPGSGWDERIGSFLHPVVDECIFIAVIV